MPGAAVGIVLAAAGYPAQTRRGDAIGGLAAAATNGALVFHAGTRLTDGAWTTDGGRILTIVGRGADLVAARVAAERAADAISWPGMQRRRDIGAAPPAPSHVEALA
jgi:phosphoribosylamine--glycine ligase